MGLRRGQGEAEYSQNQYEQHSESSSVRHHLLADKPKTGLFLVRLGKQQNSSQIKSVKSKLINKRG